MPCKDYREALIEAAASGSRPQSDLRAHLNACASCRAVFEQEQALFASIDAGLHVAANADVPGSLLPRVRVRLDEATAPRLRWVRRLVFACGGVAFAFMIFLMARPHRAAREELAKQGPVTVPASMPPAKSVNREETSSEGTQIAAIPVNRSHTLRDSTSSPSAASSNPEVLVPPDEREAFARLVGVLNERSDLGASLLAKVPEKEDGLAAVDPLQIPDIEIKPLEGTETETSHGAGEKH